MILLRSEAQVTRNRDNEIVHNNGLANQTAEGRDLLRSLDLFSNCYVKGSLHTITDTLNCNRVITHVNCSLVVDGKMGKLRTIVQEPLRLVRGLTLAVSFPGIRNQNDHV